MKVIMMILKKKEYMEGLGTLISKIPYSSEQLPWIVGRCPNCKCLRNYLICGVIVRKEAFGGHGPTVPHSQRGLLEMLLTMAGLLGELCAVSWRLLSKRQSQKLYFSLSKVLPLFLTHLAVTKRAVFQRKMNEEEIRRTLLFIQVVRDHFYQIQSQPGVTVFQRKRSKEKIRRNV